MNLTPYVDELQHHLLTAAEAGGDESRLVAERLVTPLQSATRLVLLDALAAAAGEITSDLAPGSVEVRLRGREPEFVVIPAPFDPHDDDADPGDPPDQEPAPAAESTEADEGGTSRMTLRLPEPLKARIEEAAGREGLSVNAWLVRALGAALEPAPRDRTQRRTPSGGQRYTGWARS